MRWIGVLILALGAATARADESVPVAAAGALSPTPLAGPFAALTDACEPAHDALDAGSWSAYAPFDEFECGAGGSLASVHEGAWHARAFTSRGGWKESSHRGATVLSVALHTDRGWYVALAPVVVMNANHLDGDEIESVRFEPRAEALLVRVRYAQGYRWSESKYESLLFIGVGPSRAPSTIGPIVVSEHGGHETHPKQEDSEWVEHSMRAAWSWQGQALTISAVHGDWPLSRPKIGLHRLVFR
jgi:hypothetical protein